MTWRPDGSSRRFAQTASPAIDTRNRDKTMKSKVVVYGPLYGKWYAILVNDGVAAESNQFGSYEAAMGFASRRYPELEQERQPYARGREESEDGSDSREAAPI
ncbi:hypothetical protein [Ralstonia sp. NFACC01]|jgi:hypothetical protein|uniref:hypothetical protein n=1 Tax=Ralstonia sp. NFACC01 TaxID=1566294 RepID=UPI0008EC138A|nr:hypothetical protein [Ralstonia sp. NFACC01]SFP22526.1 hypothetical protein SAMN03159417_01585 [Ralstonia sp. NFACC01]